MNILIRDIHEDDLAFIFSTWLLGLRYGNEAYKEIDKDVYFSNYKKVIDQLLKCSQVRVACLPDDPSVVLGYVVYESTRLHWVFVKKAFRKLSIASQLLPKDITSYSHVTTMIKSFKPIEWKYDPFL